MKKQKGYTLFELVWVIVIVAGAIGWIHNVIDVVHMINGPITGMLILRACGIIMVPLGAVLGYI